MARASGNPEMRIALIDGPISSQHPELSHARIQQVSGNSGAECTVADSEACRHATFVAGILIGKRSSAAPAICPDCTLLVRPIFSETAPKPGVITSATSSVLAQALFDCMDAGARLINLSLAFREFGLNGDHALDAALSHAARRGVLVVAAAGNVGALAGSAITRHPWVIPVAACDLHGRPMRESSLSTSIARRGVSAPGDGVISLGVNWPSLTFGGTSVATAFVSGAAALMWSQVPRATATEVRSAITNSTVRRASIVPPVLDAASAFQALLQTRRQVA